MLRSHIAVLIAYVGIAACSCGRDDCVVLSVSLTVRQLNSPQIKVDSLSKKVTITGGELTTVDTVLSDGFVKGLLAGVTSADEVPAIPSCMDGVGHHAMISIRHAGGGRTSMLFVCDSYDTCFLTNDAACSMLGKAGRTYRVVLDGDAVSSLESIDSLLHLDGV
jgi:hypothetical protein